MTRRCRRSASSIFLGEVRKKEDVEQHKGGRERFLIGCRYWGLKFHIYLQKETSINCFSCVGVAFIPYARQFVQAHCSRLIGMLHSTLKSSCTIVHSGVQSLVCLSFASCAHARQYEQAHCARLIAQVKNLISRSPIIKKK